MFGLAFWIVFLFLVGILVFYSTGLKDDITTTFFGYTIGEQLDERFVIQSPANESHFIQVIPKDLTFKIKDLFLHVQPSDWTICGIVAIYHTTSKDESLAFRKFVLKFMKRFGERKITGDSYVAILGKTLNCLLYEKEEDDMLMSTVHIYSPSLFSILHDEVENSKNLHVKQEALIPEQQLYEQ